MFKMFEKLKALCLKLNIFKKKPIIYTNTDLNYHMIMHGTTGTGKTAFLAFADDEIDLRTRDPKRDLEYLKKMIETGVSSNYLSKGDTDGSIIFNQFFPYEILLTPIAPRTLVLFSPFDCDLPYPAPINLLVSIYLKGTLLQEFSHKIVYSEDYLNNLQSFVLPIRELLEY